MRSESARSRDAAPATTRRKSQAARLLTGGLVTAVGLIIIFLALSPFIWLVLTSFKSDAEVVTIPVTYWPQHPTLDNYVALWTGSVKAGEMSLWPIYFANSMVISGGQMIAIIGLAALGGYGFARFRFRGENALLLLLVVTRMFPGPSLFVPIYFMISELGLQDNRFGLIVIYTAFGLPFATWLMTGVYRSIPFEVEEAAMIDGCSRLGALWRVALPLAKTGAVTVGILMFMGSWGEYGFASILLESQTNWTATVALANFIYEFRSGFNSIGAAAMMLAVPIMILLVIAQRGFTEGLLTGALRDV